MKKGAVAGAIVWSAPILTSTPAFAATAKCSGSQPCTNFYYAKVETSSCTSSTSGDGTVGGGGNKCFNLAAAASCTSTPVSFQNGCALLQAAGTFSHTGTSATVTFPAGSVPLYIQIKPGPNCFTYEWDGTKFVFFKGNAEADGTFGGPPPDGCLTNALPGGSIAATKNEDGTITVNVTWNSGGDCQGISHFNAYFCL